MQGQLSLLASLGYFTGLDNTTDPVRMKPTPIKTSAGYKSAYPLVEASNVDIDNSFAISSRDGSTVKLAGSNVHSLWSNNDVCLFVDGTILYSMNTNYAKTAILTGLSIGARMSYASVNDRVYLTNGSYIGFFRNSAMSSLPVPTATYKQPLPAGQLIAYYRGVLYVAKGNVLYCSDALCDHYDVRTGFKVFENDITMIRPVDDGIYVSDGKTYYLHEKRSFADDSSEFRKDKVLDADAISFSDVTISGALVGEGIEGNVAIWASTEGICLGDNKGAVKILTPNYSITPKGSGAAVVRNIDKQVHYITTLR